MTQGLVSIIMPSYNTADYIAESIESVLAQTYQNWELIIVDDCSADSTDEVVAGFSDPRIHYYKNEENSGAAVSRNRALKLAKGRFIAFLDSDDLWTPDKLEIQLRFMRRAKCHFSYTEYEEIGEDGKPLGVRVTGPREISKAGMYCYCWMGCLTVMYDRCRVGDIQIADIKKNNDYAMWLKICKKARCRLVPRCLAAYRKRSGSISRHSYRVLIGWHYKLWHEAEGRSMPVSVFFTFCNLAFGVCKKLFFVKHTKGGDAA